MTRLINRKQLVIHDELLKDDQFIVEFTDFDNTYEVEIEQYNGRTRVIVSRDITKDKSDED